MMFALSQSQSDLIKQLREENTRLRNTAQALCKEIEVLRDMLMNPDPDIEPDNVRLHREKCEALNRALEAEAERDRLRAEAEVEDGANTNWRHEAERLREHLVKVKDALRSLLSSYCLLATATSFFDPENEFEVKQARLALTDEKESSL